MDILYSFCPAFMMSCFVISAANSSINWSNACAINSCNSQFSFDFISRFNCSGLYLAISLTLCIAAIFIVKSLKLITSGLLRSDFPAHRRSLLVAAWCLSAGSIHRPMSSLGQHFSQISILEVLPHPAANP